MSHGGSGTGGATRPQAGSGEEQPLEPTLLRMLLAYANGSAGPLRPQAVAMAHPPGGAMDTVAHTSSVTCHVAPRDVGSGRCRLSPKLMAQLGVTLGDAVMVAHGVFCAVWLLLELLALTDVLHWSPALLLGVCPSLGLLLPAFSASTVGRTEWPTDGCVVSRVASAVSISCTHHCRQQGTRRDLGRGRVPRVACLPPHPVATHRWCGFSRRTEPRVFRPAGDTAAAGCSGSGVCDGDRAACGPQCEHGWPSCLRGEAGVEDQARACVVHCAAHLVVRKGMGRQPVG